MTTVPHYFVVEDDDDHAYLIERNLRREIPECTIERAHDGEEALHILRNTETAARPDLILLDLKLPKLNGLEVLKALKNDSSLRSIPVVMLTTSRADGDRESAYSHHVNSYLVKPMELTQFRALLRDVSHYWSDLNCRAH